MWRAICALVLLSALTFSRSGLAVSYIPPADGSLAACYAYANTTGLSSDGCPCQSNLACASGICTVNGHTCFGVTNVPVCGPVGLGLGHSAGGCPCQSNLDCKTGICPITPPPGETTSMCTSTFGPLTSPIPGVCMIGNALKISADGCPCTVSNECKSSCNTTTDTCGGLVGKVEARQPTLTATLTANNIFLGGNTSGSAVLGNTARADSGQVQFRLYAPGVDTCASFLPSAVYARNITGNGNGTYVSNTFAPTVGGVHQWTVRYTGNAFNLGVETLCNSATLRVNVNDTLLRTGFE